MNHGQNALMKVASATNADAERGGIVFSPRNPVTVLASVFSSAAGNVLPNAQAKCSIETATSDTKIIIEMAELMMRKFLWQLSASYICG
jgi:hypothetical protein